MAVRSFLGIQRKILQDMQFVSGSTPFTVPNPAGGTHQVSFYFGIPSPRVRNSPSKTRYPGWSIYFESPRPNPDWATVEDEEWLEKDPNDSSRSVGKLSDPQSTFWIDARIAVFAKSQEEFNALVAHLWRIWRVGHGQHRVQFPDDDDSSVLHNAQVRLVMQSNRYRPAEGVFLADYYFTAPVSVLLIPEQTLPTIESVDFRTALKDDSLVEVFTIFPQVFVSLLSGAGQSAPFASALPLPVTVFAVDKNGQPLANRRFSVALTGGGSILPTEGVTDSAGKFSVVWTLGPSGGQQLSFSCTPATGSPIIVTATGT
ncbi:Ig-like domain-containing protein [Candidatus Parcubacteria bacterium]|nr:Ig-like domain-containing protein [Candidatus Parcubacteria bacterium]